MTLTTGECSPKWLLPNDLFSSGLTLFTARIILRMASLICYIFLLGKGGFRQVGRSSIDHFPSAKNGQK